MDKNFRAKGDIDALLAAAMVYRCRVCGRRIPKAEAALSLKRGKVPAYCVKPRPCRNTGKSRIRRARKAQPSVGDSSDA